MAGVANYRITACCGNEGSTIVNLSNASGTFQNGLHTALVGVILGGTGFEIIQGQCYTIIELSNGPVQPNNIGYNIFSFTEAGEDEDCSLYDESPCNCPWLYFISPCCPEYGLQGAAAQQVNLFLSDIPYEDGVYVYGGPETLPIPGTNLVLEPNQCYTFTRNLQDDPIQTLIELDFSAANWSATEGCEDANCDECSETGITYLKYEPCCGGDPIYVRTETYTGIPDGQLEGANGNIGPIVNPASYTGVFQFVLTAQASQLSAFVPGQCYTGTLHTLGSEAAPAPQDNADYNNLPLAPYSTELTKAGDCERPPCPECNPTIYALTDCEGITFNTETDLSDYVGTYIEIETPNGVIIPGCWFVQEYSGVSGITDEATVDKRIALDQQTTISNNLPGLQTQPVVVTGPCSEDCPCLCYEVIGYTGRYSYINCEGKSVSILSSGADKFCAQARPNIIGVEGEDYTLVVGNACVDDECPEQCFLLTNCDPTAWPEQDATLNSTLQSLSQYAATNEVVVLSGYDGCWTVTETVECDCPIDVTVIRDFRDCEECLGITAYKLFNCEKINEVLYTLQDLSAYVGKVIKDDCACWVVEEIDYQPPSETTITDPIVFEDCTTCLTTYYTLTDCNDSESVIVTSTNLSAYVGQVVKIEGCDPCYEVALYEDTTAPESWEEVTVTEASATCFDCQQLVPRCSTVFNNSTEDRTFTFINANGDPEETDTVISGHFSLRYCVQYWDEPDSFIYNYHGDCTVYENPNGGLPGECNCFQINVQGTEGPVLNILANHTGTFLNGKKVYDLTIDGIPYYFWSTGVGGQWYITDQLGGVTLSGTLGQIKSGFPDCPEAPSGSWTPGRLPPGTSEDAVIWMESNLTDCEPLYEGFCVQYFPNDRKVKPGYNTPICSADKYDKITCKFAEIAYKNVLELRYGISNCCPEEDVKWLIKKELIELQALTDPNYTCDPLTDCCGNPTSQCSCNS